MRLLVLYALLAASSALALWPHPALHTLGHEAVRIDTAGFKITLPPNTPQDVQDAADRTKKRIAEDYIRPLKLGYGANRLDKIQKSPVLSEIEVVLSGAGIKRSELVLSEESADRARRQVSGGIFAEITQPLSKLEESYTLDVPADGSKAKLTAKSALGVLRGLTTFEQLIHNTPSKKDTQRYIWHAPHHIEDKPAYPYRGLMLDTSRNYLPVAAIKRQLDAMSFVKQNQFHWHITDAQSFPLELPGDLAALAQAGSYGEDERYSADDVKDIVTYAGARGINVNVEIDMPGHNLAGVQALPGNLTLCENKNPWDKWANEPPSGQLKLGNKAVDKYVSDLIASVSSLFPGPYYGSGGDEVNLHCYGAKKASDIDASLLKPFVQNVQRAVAKAGKVSMVWEEMAIDFPETGKALAKGTIVEAWTGPDNVGPILKNPNLHIIHAPVDFFYLDCGVGEWLTGTQGQSWCEHVSWQKMYSFDPKNGTQGIFDGAARVYGGESALWAEQSDEVSLDSYIWPRNAAGAEVFWTGESFSQAGKVHKRNAHEAQRRIDELRFRLVDRGYAAQPLQPLWCTLRRGQCNMPADLL